jgi:hypothetical protein
MEPLDLTLRPPRGPREQLDGLMMLPRTIDKARASLPGGNLGRYVVKTGISALMLQKLGVGVEDFIACVAGASSDADVAAWLRGHADASQYDRVNAFVSGLRDEDVPAAHRAFFESLYPERLRTAHRLNFDLLEADDREMFPDHQTVSVQQ